MRALLCQQLTFPQTIGRSLLIQVLKNFCFTAQIMVKCQELSTHTLLRMKAKRALDKEDHSIKEYDDDNLDEYDDSDEYEDSDDQLGLQDFSPQQKYKVATEVHAIIRRQLEQQDLDADSRIPLLDELGKHEDYIVAKKKQ